MAFCPNCGKQSEGKFCAHCGGSMGGGQTPPSPGAPPPSGDTGAGLPENAANALCYLIGFITGILFLVMEPYSKNPRTRFHAFQSIFLNLAFIAYYFACGFLYFIMPGPIVFLLVGLNMLIGFAIFFLWLFMMWKTYQGDTVVLPIIGPLAQQQAAK